MSRTVWRESFQFMIKLCSLPIVCVCGKSHSLTSLPSSAYTFILFHTFNFHLPGVLLRRTDEQRIGLLWQRSHEFMS